MNSILYVETDYELWDMDGSILTYVYVDGVELDRAQAGVGKQGTLSLMQASQVSKGKHIIEAVQFADNDPSGTILFYRSASYTVK